MSYIDIDSVLSKVKKYIGSSEGIKRSNDVVKRVMLGQIKLSSGQSIHTPEEAADKFISVLRQAIISSGLSANAITAVSDIDHTNAYSFGNNKYAIFVYFSGDMYRPSLNEAKYGGVDDIVMLLNDGVDHRMRPVKGTWHEQEIWSRTVIPGAHFIEQAVSDFMGNYATEYNVSNISISKT